MSSSNLTRRVYVIRAGYVRKTFLLSGLLLGSFPKLGEEIITT